MLVQCCRSDLRMVMMARGFIGVLSCFPMAESFKAEIRTRKRKDDESDESRSSSSSSSSSSIGRDSDLMEEIARPSIDEDDEIQSSFRSGPLDSMDALEEVLPIRRGISEFYGGKSKSFASLQDASTCSSAKEIAKPDNAYTRKRKNLMNYMLRRGLIGDEENNNTKRSKRTNQSCGSVVSKNELLLTVN